MVERGLRGGGCWGCSAGALGKSVLMEASTASTGVEGRVAGMTVVGFSDATWDAAQRRMWVSIGP